MKRFLMLLICLGLLTGCRAEPQPTAFPETEPGASAESLQATEPQNTLPPEQPGVPLLDQGEAAGASENLLYIPNPHVESMACPEIRLYGNGLLLYEHTPEGMVQLKRISLEDGSLLAQGSYPGTPGVTVQIGSGLIGLCDSGSGQVQILNEWLEPEATFTVPFEGENWYLNQELETLYVFVYDKGLLAYDLATGEIRWLLDNAAFVRTLGATTGYVLFSYTDQADQRTYKHCLNLSTATLETLPLEGIVQSGIRSGAQWLLGQDIASGTYVLADQEAAVTFTRSEGLVELLPGRRQLLVTDESYRELTLYDLEGKFLSRCDLPQREYASVGTDFVWSGYWQGYFFRDTYDNAAHLMFWNPETAQTGENLAMIPLGTVQAPENVMDKALYQRAQELSQRFGLDIRIAEQCGLDYTHYQADALTDPNLVRRALDVLELAFACYPEGFFPQLRYGDISRIRIELVVNLRGQEDMDTHPESIGGFAQENTDYYLIVFESPSLDLETVFHEFSHVIDKRLEWDASLRPRALFSEETWLSLQPEGFRYAHSYVDMPEDIAAYEDSGYFVRAYSMTFPTEDRATLMSATMTDKTILWENPGMAAKMRYYAACIRDCFDTEGWPEKTVWE